MGARKQLAVATAVAVVLALACGSARAAGPATLESEDGVLTMTGTDVTFALEGSSTTLSSMLKRMAALEGTLTTVTADLGKVQADLSAAQGQIKTLEEKAQKAEQQRGTTDKSVGTVSDTVDTIKSDLKKIQDTSSTAPAALTAADITSVKFTVVGAAKCAVVDTGSSTTNTMMTRDGVPVSLPNNGRQRGMTVAAFSPTDYKLVGVYGYDTFADKDASGKMATFINGLAANSIVMASIYDEGVSSLGEVGYKALESIGSVLIRDIKHRESWAIIGRKGAALGSVPEDHGKASIASPSQCQLAQGSSVSIPAYMPRPTRLLEEIVFMGKLGAKITESFFETSRQAAFLRNDQRLHGVEIAVKSYAGCTNYDGDKKVNQFMVYRDGKRVVLPTLPADNVAGRRGYNFITFEPLTLTEGCDIKGLGCPVFDTHGGLMQNVSGKMLEWVNSLPVGTVVAGGIIDDGSHGIDDLGYDALESLGLTLMRQIKFRESYAFVAQKGDVRGGAVEDHGTEGSEEGITANEKMCTNRGMNSYHPRPTALLRRMFFTGMAGVPLDQEFGRRAGGRAVARELEDLSNTISRDMITIDAQSAGACVGSYFSVTVNGQDVAPLDSECFLSGTGRKSGGNCLRGIFVVAIDGETLQLVHKRMYDLFSGDVGLYKKFYSDMVSLPDGTIVAAVMKDAITINNAVNIENGMKLIGAKQYKNLGYRESWAVIGIKGQADDAPVNEDVGRYTTDNPPPSSGYTFQTSCTKSTAAASYQPRATKILTSTFFSQNAVSAIKAIKNP